MTRTPRPRCEWAEEVVADDRREAMGKAQVSSPVGDQGWDVSLSGRGRGRSCTSDPIAAKAVSRERKAAEVAKNSGKGAGCQECGKPEGSGE